MPDFEVLDLSEPFRLSKETIDQLVENCKASMEAAIREALEGKEFKIGDYLEFMYLIDFENGEIESGIPPNQTLN